MHAQVTYECIIQHGAENLRSLKILFSETTDIYARNMKGHAEEKVFQHARMKIPYLIPILKMTSMCSGNNKTGTSQLTGWVCCRRQWTYASNLTEISLKITKY